jgi:hypothetical protein
MFRKGSQEIIAILIALIAVLVIIQRVNVNVNVMRECIIFNGIEES